jgi:hypothetical protein
MPISLTVRSDDDTTILARTVATARKVVATTIGVSHMITAVEICQVQDGILQSTTDMTFLP